jgi:hypothetical protein
MTYQVIDQLTNDPGFNTRMASCCTEQAMTFKDDDRPAFSSLANDILRGSGMANSIFVRMGAVAPGVADKATVAGGIDSTLITDEDILSIVQAQWPVVADLLYVAPPASSQTR